MVRIQHLDLTEGYSQGGCYLSVAPSDKQRAAVSGSSLSEVMSIHCEKLSCGEELCFRSKFRRKYYGNGYALSTCWKPSYTSGLAEGSPVAGRNREGSRCVGDTEADGGSPRASWKVSGWSMALGGSLRHRIVGEGALGVTAQEGDSTQSER